MGSDCVSVRTADFEGAVGEVDLHVTPQVLLEVKLLLGGLERIVESPEPVSRKQFLFGNIDIWVDNEVGLYDFCDFVFLDTARGMVRGSVLGNRGPVVRLFFG